MYRIDPMTVEDVPEVSRVEARCFNNPWPQSAYRRELQAPEQNYYVVLREEPAASGNGAAGEPATLATGNPRDGLGSTRPLPRRTLLPLGLGRRAGAAGEASRHLAPIIGFAGMWNMFDEAHITTIGVEPGYRGRGLGELLLAAMFDEALRRGANWLTLEVRVSNEAAQSLYRKYGFAGQGTRRRYYSDNNEDALIMWSRSLQDPTYLEELRSRRETLVHRLGGEPIGFGARSPRLNGRPTAAR